MEASVQIIADPGKAGPWFRVDIIHVVCKIASPLYNASKLM
jgi:hypothetical protein